MAAKPNEPAKDAAAPAKESPPPSSEKGSAAEAPAKAGGITALIPLIAAIILAPALSWAVGQFVLLPKLQKQLALPVDAHAVEAAAEEAAAEEPAHGGKEAKEGKEGAHGKAGEAAARPDAYEFENIVVNLAGTMGTRYLKTAFIVTGKDKTLRGVFEGNKPKLVDVTINVLSSLSLTDLEEAGAKNLIREKLVGAYNQALGKKVVDQVYFSDFVVQ